MKRLNRKILRAAVLALLAGTAGMAQAVVFVQCPGDTNGDAVIDVPVANHPNAKCMHLVAGDGMTTMADGHAQYIFGYRDVTGLPPASDPQNIPTEWLGTAEWPAPTIELKEGQEFYLTLTNVGMPKRPDLFDAHSVHFHGFPQAAAVFDGEPMASMGVNMGSSLTYYYSIKEPGTYLYHCHVEASEHMQMGMLGQLFVHPAQDGTPITYQGRSYTKFAYNDGDGSTGYNVEAPLQLSSFDPEFHDKHFNVQPLPFEAMKDTYGMINGRGYPDTVNMVAPDVPVDPNGEPCTRPDGLDCQPSQHIHSLIEAKAGDKILIRLTSVSTTDFFTFRVLGLPMQVVGKDAKHLRSQAGKTLYYSTNAVTIGGGETFDILVDTTGAQAGDVYPVYSTNLNFLSNNTQDYGGLMTEIHITQ
jgi:FtsP/CotA-like multicopper oxidase with cupredoxin domain